MTFLHDVHDERKPQIGDLQVLAADGETWVDCTPEVVVDGVLEPHLDKLLGQQVGFEVEMSSYPATLMTGGGRLEHFAHSYRFGSTVINVSKVAMDATIWTDPDGTVQSIDIDTGDIHLSIHPIHPQISGPLSPGSLRH